MVANLDEHLDLDKNGIKTARIVAILHLLQIDVINLDIFDPLVIFP